MKLHELFLLIDVTKKNILAHFGGIQRNITLTK